MQRKTHTEIDERLSKAANQQFDFSRPQETLLAHVFHVFGFLIYSFQELTWVSMDIKKYNSFIGFKFKYDKETASNQKLAKDLVDKWIVNWKMHLKFPEEARLSLEAKDLISKLLCNVNQRLGSKGADEIKAHPWFRGIDWEIIYQMEATFIPEVNDELDTQKFEKFEEHFTL
ncbi:hypothetical protein L2E82_38981 [Cichorium intybus]|uniref:Uncharacterized protein n=1 Tax=Cichorium intybus TaxID=13427 RepID=A0ACB9AG86_CICIN|nr:hypothetical protein L2E82_38981 [Cichorium intybus]